VKRVQEEVSQYQVTFGKRSSSEYQSFAKKLLAVDPSQRLQAAAAAKSVFGGSVNYEAERIERPF